jgi:hypothetical protein
VAAVATVAGLILVGFVAGVVSGVGLAGLGAYVLVEWLWRCAERAL